MVETRSQKKQTQTQKPALVVVRYNLRPRVAAAVAPVEAKVQVRVGTLHYNLRPRN
jgi:hypothetical protein